MLRLFRKHTLAPFWFALAAALAAISASAGMAAPSKTDTSTRSTCRSSVHAQRAAPSANPLSRQIAFLKQATGKGWRLTAAGRSIVAGAAPPAVKGTGAVVVATKRPSSSGTRRQLQRVHRIQGFIRDVWMYCLAGERANIDYEVHAGASEHVEWQDHNTSTGAGRDVTGPTTVCPSSPPGDCLVYAYHKPAAPWAVVLGSIYVTPISGYKQLDFDYCDS
jgi:hypothetical protein